MHVFFLVTFLFQPIATYQNAKATQTDLIGIFWIFYWLWLDLHKMWVCLCMFLFWICTLPSVWFKWLNEEHSGFHWKYALLVFILLVAVSKYRHLFAQHFGFMFGIYFMFCLGSFSIWLWLMWFIQISSKINWCFAMS